ncbi:MAG TPA: hypothetical protein DCR37_06400 [Glaciecola sp.]|nr:hypothetical protein [Glaciecola sp.]
MNDVKIGLKKLVLSKDSRDQLLSRFPPKFAPNSKHVTLEFGPLSSNDDDVSSVTVVGYQSSSYLEVLVVEMNGSSTRRSDNKTLHITHSLKPGVPPVCSNDVLEEMLWHPISPITVEVTPKTVNFN